MSTLAAKRPLVYAAVGALAHARQVMPGRVLEREVTEAILAGDVNAGRDGGFVFGDSWVARCVRVPGRLRDRPRAWLVVSVERRQR